jgi:pimeloyl-ACP methyl ester carboxylesterase
MECQLDKLTVHYEVVGEGRPILMLHGATLDYRHMVSDMEPAFVGRSDWRRIYLDLPGHGRTPVPNWLHTQDDVLGVVLDFIDHVIPNQQFTLVGTSWGGTLSRGVLAKRFDQIEGLCLIVTPMIRDDYDPELVVVVANPQLVAEAAALDPRAGEVMRSQPVQIRAVLDWWQANSRPAKEFWDATFADRFWNTPNEQFSFDIRVLPKPFPGPALIFMGRQDDVVRYTDAWPVVEDYPRATVALLDRAGHLAMVHQRTLFNALVNEWLDRLEEYVSH